jgi:hypothetical protein
MRRVWHGETRPAHSAAEKVTQVLVSWNALARHPRSCAQSPRPTWDMLAEYDQRDVKNLARKQKRQHAAHTPSRLNIAASVIK